jgi:4,5-DOPA dioxygenase extradiol
MKRQLYSRRTVLAGLGLAAAAGAVGFKMTKSSKTVIKELQEMPDSERMPAVFIGHGSPMNAIDDNAWTRAWRDLGSGLPQPKAILAISAHWITQGGLLVTAGEHPPMTYDMGGFPAELYRIQYPAPGSPALAEEIEKSLHATIPVHGDTLWGYDHGTWVVLKHMFPRADIPVIQLSLDYSKPPAFHFELAKQLRPLRDKGVLILGSGNIVHNLREMVRSSDSPFDWALEFDRRMNEYLMDGNFKAIVEFQKLGSLAAIAHPTYDHFLPLLYMLGVQNSGEEVRSVCDGFQYKSVSMRSLQVG